MLENNECSKVRISGKIEKDFEFSHNVLWEKFYKTRVEVTRYSGIIDFVPIVVSDILIFKHLKKSLKGKYVEISGQFRSHNLLGEDSRKHLDLFLFVEDIKFYNSEEEIEGNRNTNYICLDGYICKTPIFRLTPRGRQITDMMVAVNRAYHKSDYIPCIVWGRAAIYASELEIGDRIKLEGRIQSREYFKRYSPDSEEGEYKTAYEISIVSFMKEN